MDLYTTNTISGQGTSEEPLGIVDDLIYYGEVSGYLNSTTAGNVVISAVVPSGYKFVSWLGTSVVTRSSINTVGLVFNQNEPTSARIYAIAKGTTNTAKCFATYLCLKEN